MRGEPRASAGELVSAGGGVSSISSSERSSSSPTTRHSPNVSAGSMPSSASAASSGISDALGGRHGALRRALVVTLVERRRDHGQRPGVVLGELAAGAEQALDLGDPVGRNGKPRQRVADQDHVAAGLRDAAGHAPGRARRSAPAPRARGRPGRARARRPGAPRSQAGASSGRSSISSTISFGLAPRRRPGRARAGASSARSAAPPGSARAGRRPAAPAGRPRGRARRRRRRAAIRRGGRLRRQLVEVDPALLLRLAAVHPVDVDQRAVALAATRRRARGRTPRRPAGSSQRRTCEAET